MRAALSRPILLRALATGALGVMLGGCAAGEREAYFTARAQDLRPEQGTLEVAHFPEFERDRTNSDRPAIAGHTVNH